MEHHIASDHEAIDKKRIKMTTQSVGRLICSLAVPSILTMLISALYNMADTYFVGSLGTSAIGGVGVIFPLMAIIQALGFFFGQGAGIMISRLLGSNDVRSAESLAVTGAMLSFACGAVLGGAGFVSIVPLVRSLGATDTIEPYAIAYGKYILIAFPWMMCSLTLNNILRYQGSSFYGMIGMVSGAVLNIVLDPIFIFTLDLGATGASIATALSQLAGLIILLLACGRASNLSLDLRKISLGVSTFKTMIRGGFPSLCRQGLGGVCVVLVNRAASGYGDAAIAAMSIVLRIVMLANSVLIGFGHGFQPVSGYNYGAKRYDRVMDGFYFCVKTSTIFLLVVAAILYIFASDMITIFRAGDQGVIDHGIRSIRLIAPAMPLYGVIIISNMLFQTIGRMFTASLLAMARMGLFTIPLLFVLRPIFAFYGVQMSIPIGDVMAFLLCLYFDIKIIREFKASTIP